MSRGYSATPLWGLSPNSVVAAFFRENLSATFIVHISALRWTKFHQNRKDPTWEIQQFPNLGHNLCENDKQTLHDYI